LCCTHRQPIDGAGPGPIDACQLPLVPPPPAALNADVTTLCALVSEVTNADPALPQLRSWADRTSHWRVGHSFASSM